MLSGLEEKQKLICAAANELAKRLGVVKQLEGAFVQIPHTEDEEAA